MERVLSLKGVERYFDRPEEKLYLASLQRLFSELNLDDEYLELSKDEIDALDRCLRWDNVRSMFNYIVQMAKENTLVRENLVSFYGYLHQYKNMWLVEKLVPDPDSHYLININNGAKEVVAWHAGQVRVNCLAIGAMAALAFPLNTVECGKFAESLAVTNLQRQVAKDVPHYYEVKPLGKRRKRRGKRRKKNLVTSSMEFQKGIYRIAYAAQRFLYRKRTRITEHGRTVSYVDPSTLRR